MVFLFLKIFSLKQETIIDHEFVGVNYNSDQNIGNLNEEDQLVLKEAKELLQNYENKEELSVEIEELVFLLNELERLIEQDKYRSSDKNLIQKIIDRIKELIDRIKDIINPDNNEDIDEVINEREELINKTATILFEQFFKTSKDSDLLNEIMGGYEEGMHSQSFLEESWLWFDIVQNDLKLIESDDKVFAASATAHVLLNEEPSNKTVFLAHDYRSNLYKRTETSEERYFLTPKAYDFYNNGYNVVFLNVPTYGALNIATGEEILSNFGIKDKNLYL